MTTKTIKHHVSDELLLEYAAGSLEEGWSIAVATHLALCPECRKRLAAMEVAGGAMMEAIEPETDADFEESAWAAMLSRLEKDDGPDPVSAKRIPENTTSGAEKPSAADLAIPEPLRTYIGGSLENLKWKRLGVGAYHYPIATGDEKITARLLRIPAGKPVPEHSHTGRELTLVLTGAFVSEGVTFGPGDLEEEDDDTVHQPMVTPDAECICLAVTEAPLKFQSRVVRLVQPFLGI